MDGPLAPANSVLGEKIGMKILKKLCWTAPLALLIAGCAMPVTNHTPYAEWQREDLLPQTGSSVSRVYPQPATYPAADLNIIVQSDDRRNANGDFMLASAIRQQVEYDRGLTPSLQGVTIEVHDGRVILKGTVKSDLDSRIIVDNLRDITGVTRIINNLQIDPDMG